MTNEVELHADPESGWLDLTCQQKEFELIREFLARELELNKFDVDLNAVVEILIRDASGAERIRGSRSRSLLSLFFMVALISGLGFAIVGVVTTYRWLVR